MDATNTVTFGSLRAERQARGLTQVDLARLADCSVSYVRLLEAGFEPQRTRVLARVIEALGAPVTEGRATAEPGEHKAGARQAHVEFALPEAVIDDIAARVAARLADILAPHVAAALAPPDAADGLVDATAVAAALGTSRAWVYEHASELGGMRLGDGARPRWRFNLDAALAARQSAAQPTTLDQPAPRRPRTRRHDASPGAILTPKPSVTRVKARSMDDEADAPHQPASRDVFADRLDFVELFDDDK